MSKNIKDIGKELMGKSLNSFHRKTGLTQLEKNNKMQDGILNGILSQVDDAYIEKTEQSNVIHLDGSGDGVVVVDSIEGNTMVNLGSLKKLTIFNSIGNLVANYDGIYYNGNFKNAHYLTSISMQPIETLNMQQGKTYTLIQYQKLNTSIYNDDSVVKRNSGFVFYSKSSGSVVHLDKDAFSQSIGVGETKITKTKFTVDTRATHFDLRLFTANLPLASKEVDFSYWFILLEGDYVDKEIDYFEGMQSTFEECKVTQEMVDNGEELEENLGKYKCLAKVRGKNLFDGKLEIGSYNVSGLLEKLDFYVEECRNANLIDVKGINSVVISGYTVNDIIIWQVDENLNILKIDISSSTNLLPNTRYIAFRIANNDLTQNIQLEEGTQATSYEPYFERTQTVYLSSPLLKGDEIVCKEDGLYHYHKMCKVVLDGSEDEGWASSIITNNNGVNYMANAKLLKNGITGRKALCDKLCVIYGNQQSLTGLNQIAIHNIAEYSRYFYISTNKDTVEEFKAGLQANPITAVYELSEPYYEKITNEYGEPIIMEGYENGTLYIDSTIVPTTTVRYTPKMESFKTYKEVKIRNAINDFDVTENVIPYMMEVDMKLTELEMSAISTYNIKNIRKMEVLDMTSMQERTFKMLERLIRGKSHTKQELIDRVLLYEQAKRITTEQALELNLIIEEVYGA